MVQIVTNKKQLRRFLLEADRKGVEDLDQDFIICIGGNKETDINIHVPNLSKGIQDLRDNQEALNENEIIS